MDYRFYLRDPKVTTEWTEIEEPDGWDALSITMQRSDAYTGLENVYSDNITFVETGARYLQGIFDLYLFDALIDFKWEYYCNDVLIESFFGSINMITYSEINNQISVKIEESSFSRKLLNRIETIVNLDAETSIEGLELSPLTKTILPLHSKVISLQSSFIKNDFLSDYEELGINDESFNALYFPLDVASDEFETAEGTTVMFDINAPLPYSKRYLFTAPVAGVYTFAYDLKGFVQESSSATRSFNFSIAFTTSSNVDYQVKPITAHSQTGGTITIPYDLSGSFDIPLGAGESVALFSRIFNSTPSRSADLRQVMETASLSIQSYSIYESSTAESYKIYEALNRIVESITDTQDAIRSDFFGRTDSAPYSYDENGCGSWLTTLNGKAIRAFINDKVMVGSSMSFKSLFDALDCQYSIGFRVEEIAGKLYLRIEPKEYFYNAETIMQFSNVSDIKKSISTKDIYNNFDIGYEKWEIEEINGIDEINTQHQYSIPITTGSNKLSKLSTFVAGAYAIEYTRRQQFKITPTTDWKFDDDNFFIALSMIDQTFDNVDDDPYKLEGITYPYTYLAGSVPERNESFDYVNNYLVPETGYNIRLSPTRMAMNWHPILAASITQDLTKNVNFQSGQGNVFESDKLIDICEPTIEEIQQNMNISRDLFEVFKRDAFYKPVLYQFEYPGTFTDFRFLRLNSNKSIEFSCESTNFIKGFIKEIVFEPNSESGGILKISAYESGCTLGAFDESFDESFDIGTCQ